MPLSVFKKLGLGEPKPTTVSLQLADRSITYPRGIIEDVLIKVGHLVFPTDFIVLDMEEDQSIPLILGRPFLNTAKASIEVHEGKLTLRIDNDHVSFYLPKKEHSPNEHCFKIDSIIPNYASSSHALSSLQVEHYSDPIIDSITQHSSVEL